MTKILFMHQASTIGGGSYCLLNIVKSLDYSLFEPIVALRNHGPLEDELINLGVSVVIFPEMVSLPYNKPLWKWRSIKTYLKIHHSIPKFKELLSNLNVSIVYFNNMMLCRYLQPAKECNCKTVIHVREHWPLDEHVVQLSWARNCVYNYADKLIAINHYSASIFPEKKAAIVYDWIDFSDRYEYIPLDSIFNEDTSKLKVYLFTGGMQHIKGTLEVVKVFSEEIKDEDCRLLILGLQNIVSQSWLKKVITKSLDWLGHPTYGYHVRKIVNSDPRIVCIPATYSIKHIMEQIYCILSYFTIPHANLAIAESIILGKPIIAAETEESLEYSKNGSLARLFTLNDVAAFAKTIQQLNDDYDQLRKKIELEKGEIERMFSPKRNITQLQDQLIQLI